MDLEMLGWYMWGVLTISAAIYDAGGRHKMCVLCACMAILVAVASIWRGLR